MSDLKVPHGDQMKQADLDGVLMQLVVNTSAERVLLGACKAIVSLAVLDREHADGDQNTVIRANSRVALVDELSRTIEAHTKALAKVLKNSEVSETPPKRRTTGEKKRHVRSR